MTKTERTKRTIHRRDNLGAKRRRTRADKYSAGREQSCFEAREGTYDGAPDLVCLSHLRWNFVFQRPQHLMSRFARQRRVFFVEEPLYGTATPWLDLRMDPSGVCVMVPHLPEGLDKSASDTAQEALINKLFIECSIRDCLLWYYTPMALSFTRHIKPLAAIYDCMDELRAFRNAPPELISRETELFGITDVVFTGGHSLYEAKTNLHSNVHCFPSSIDAEHFRQARVITEEADDQKGIPCPRLGFAGVIDERMDFALVDTIAATRPDWHIVLIGPIVKVDPAELPRRSNIHYMGARSYQDLPRYLAGWNVALMPFAHNDSTRFISPTKTPEYLAAGKCVISTSIQDVVRTYGEKGLVRIADTADDFVAAAEEILSAKYDSKAWLERVDTFLGALSWDRTWEQMLQLIERAIASRTGTSIANPASIAQPFAEIRRLKDVSKNIAK